MSVADLTKELISVIQGLIQNIQNDDEYTLQATVRAMQLMSDLKSVILKSPFPVPDLFLCPICKQFFSDPVVVSTGLTYDRACIQRWFDKGYEICPESKQKLTNKRLTPNILVKELIREWGEKRGVEMPSSEGDDGHDIQTRGLIVNQELMRSLIQMLFSTSRIDKMWAAPGIRKLTNISPIARAHFGEFTNDMARLIEALSSSRLDIQEDLIGAILNITQHDNNRELVGNNPQAIPLLISFLRSVAVGKRIQATATAALSSLADIESNKNKILEAGALKPLIQVLEEGDPIAMMEATSAIHKLCKDGVWNKRKAVDEGIVPVMIKKMEDPLLRDGLLSLLTIFSGYKRANEEMIEHGALSLFLRILNDNTVGDLTRDYCVEIIFHMISYDEAKTLEQIGEDEHYNHTMLKVYVSGTSRSKLKAFLILKKLDAPGAGPSATGAGPSATGAGPSATGAEPSATGAGPSATAGPDGSH